MRFLTAHWELKLLSLLAAVLLWGFVVGGEQSEMILAVPVEFRGIPPGLELTGERPDSVDVQLRGLRFQVLRLRGEALRAQVPLMGARPGEMTLQLLPEHVRVPAGVRVVRITPSRLRVVLEALESATVEVVPRLTGTPPAGFVLKEVQVSPPVVEVRGPRSEVRLLTHVETVPIDLSALRGPMLETALAAGALSAGAECYMVGILPTPAIALLTRQLQAHGGVVISASHNPFEDNGIKLFSAEGTKFPDAWEREIETRLAARDSAPRPSGALIGRLVAYRRAEADYIRFLRSSFPLDLQGFTLVLDCAHGATYRVAPRLFRALGARVLTRGSRPDGTNINRRCGALFPEGLQKKVKAVGAQVGFAFDGDGDRLIAVDEAGEVRDGDYLLAIFARHLKARGQLNGNQVVTTVMANLGLDRSLAGVGIGVVKTRVGDRYVLEEMERRGANLGGEQSGHIIFSDRALTGDGLLSALQLLAIMRAQGQGLSALARCLIKVPQVLVNVQVKAKPPIESIPGLTARMQAMETAMNGAGRILVRYSGTEPLARVMIEGEDLARILAMAKELAALIASATGGRPIEEN